MKHTLILILMLVLMMSAGTASAGEHGGKEISGPQHDMPGRGGGNSGYSVIRGCACHLSLSGHTVDGSAQQTVQSIGR